MAKKNEANDKLVDTAAVIGAQAKQVVDSLAKGLGVAATELWSIFVRQYVVRGLNELFTAIVLFVVAFFLKDYVGFYALIPATIGIGFVYGAISYLGNPKYYALNDIVRRIKDLKEEGKTKIKKEYYL